MKNFSFKAFIFDMDGVLIDSEPLHSRAKKATFERFGLEFDDVSLPQYMGMTSKDIFTDIVRNSGREDLSAQELTDFKHNFYIEELEAGGAESVAGGAELVQALHAAGVPLALASSSWERSIYAVLRQLGIKGCFDYIISGGSLPRSKPDPAIYLVTAERLGAAPADCLVLEDTTNGIVAAKRAGMQCIAYRNPNSGSQDLTLADEVTDSLWELKEQLIK